MKYTLGFSPCPNDTFIFDALVNHLIDTHGLEFDVRLEDVETLNSMALRGELDFTKVSYGVLPLILDHYRVLNSGSALGKGVGPLLIAKHPVPLESVPECRIIIPGENTTAHFLFSRAFPGALKKEFKRYDTIEQSVLSSDGSTLGVIIHENRFTYAGRGLTKIVDLGNFWEEQTGYPIPLGGIAGKKTLGNQALAEMDTLIRTSIEHSFAGYPHMSGYVREHAQEMDAEVMKKHIDLYVNEFSLALGTQGRDAILKLLGASEKSRGLPLEDMFVGADQPLPTAAR